MIGRVFLYVYFMITNGLHYFIRLVNEWRGKYHINSKGDIIIQNKTTMANVVFTHNSMHRIQEHSKGVDDLPDTIMTPDSIWSKWEDVKTQRVVLRNYIRGNYIVQTRNGIITDAFATAQVNKYRVGVLIVL